ncbi:MAG: hypothetical protein PVF40_06075 [Ectothiorhodospiraceae bacterium]
MNPPIVVDRQAAEAIVDDAVRRYIRTRRERVDAFVSRHFTLSGSLKLHRHVIGRDLYRAPLNMVAGLAVAGSRAGAGAATLLGARRTAERLRAIRPFRPTDLGAELEWLLHSELLELPFDSGDRRTRRDALAEELLRDPRIQTCLVNMLDQLSQRTDIPGFQDRLTDALAEYVGSRAAAADLSVGLVSAATGWATFRQATPGIAALSSTVAGNLAYASAIQGFWAGPGLGSLWYGMVGVTTPAWLTAGVFGALVIPAAVLAAFSGVVTDPVQRRLGLHQRRLQRLLDSLEQALLGRGDGELRLRDHYVARVLDMADWAQAAVRVARMT